jgi:hypothetical protein
MLEESGVVPWWSPFRSARDVTIKKCKNDEAFGSNLVSFQYRTEERFVVSNVLGDGEYPGSGLITT